MMEVNLWAFLAVSVILGVVFLVVLITNISKTKQKALELELLKTKKANIEAEVEAAVNKKLGDQLNRIEVLEAIVTDKNYELNEKITRLK